jgi:hypothetical protein
MVSGPVSSTAVCTQRSSAISACLRVRHGRSPSTSSRKPTTAAIPRWYCRPAFDFATTLSSGSRWPKRWQTTKWTRSRQSPDLAGLSQKCALRHTVPALVRPARASSVRRGPRPSIVARATTVLRSAADSCGSCASTCRTSFAAIATTRLACNLSPRFVLAINYLAA